MNVEVELDIFSGVPNPVWTLRDAEVIEFRAKVSELQETESKSRSNGLGYRGLVVRIRQGSPQEMRIHNGFVEASQGRASSNTLLLDSSRSLERWLLAIGRAFVEDDIYAVIEADLGDSLAED